MKKLVIVALMAILMPAFAWAQYRVSGKITAKNTNEGLPGATITLKSTTQTVVSNNNGDYALTNIKAGKYTLRLSYVGYQTIEKAITVQGDLSLNLVLLKESLVTDEVIVRATRASANSANTYRNIHKAEIEKNNQGQDLPYLLNQTPSVVITSDAGAGVGYTSIRVRGSDPTRTNVTINGIPYNDSESQGSFFVDLPDLASSVDNIQVQRGVGTSTNGAGAFGASINIQTNTRRDSAYAELNNTFGSYRTWKNTINLGTGLINNKFSIDGRLSRVSSDGYIDRAASTLKSYFLSGAYYGKNSLLRVNVFSGQEKTYQAWNGIPEERLRGDIAGMKKYVAVNGLNKADSANLLNSGNRTYNSFTYKDQTDNYTQDHYQLLYSHSFSPQFSFNGALHYTYGRGYFEEYKNDADLTSYGLTPVVLGGVTINTSDLVRRRWLDNNFYGATYSFNYTPKAELNFTLGGAYNEYDGKHYGQVIWTQNSSSGNNQDHYYDGKGLKKDFNVFGKVSYQLDRFTLFADLQYRHLYYKISGMDKDRNLLNQQHNMDFFNPKAGITYQINETSNVYASFAVANKEPNRDDYINAKPIVPTSENLKDFEFGYRTKGSDFNLGINGFAMLYKNQLVPTGKVNDVSEPIRENIPDSYRLGIEVDGKWQILPQLSFVGSLAWSRNKVKNFTEYITNYDKPIIDPATNATIGYGQDVNQHSNTDIAYSPDLVGSGELNYSPFKNAEIAFISKYVSKQYLDNTSNNNRKINDFFVNDVRLYYNTSILGLKNIGITFRVNNVFSKLYETNGFTYSDISGGNLSNHNSYFPQATRNFLLSLNVKF